ncbi:hypothetical protein HRbin37_00278 [bacterium HR37]|nr:hypothetical protein HRbin37_00278 [bacterium HR37]
MHSKIPVCKILIITLLYMIGCTSTGKKEQPLSTEIPGIKTQISKILISPLAFDGAIVVVEGIAKDVSYTRGITKFKVSDTLGNFINVSFTKPLDIEEDDYIAVGGIYRRTKNEIEAREVRKSAIKVDTLKLEQDSLTR